MYPYDYNYLKNIKDPQPHISILWTLPSDNYLEKIDKEMKEIDITIL